MKRLRKFGDSHGAMALPAMRNALRRSAPLGLMAAALCLAGCESIPFKLGSNTDEGASSAAMDGDLANLPEPKPFPPKPPTDKAVEKMVKADVGAETPLPVEKPPVTTLSESQIVGAHSQELQSLIGRPERVVTNAPSQTWYYAGGPCRFSVQFFKDLDSGEYRALKYSVDGGSLERCLAQFERFNGLAPIEAQSDFMKQGSVQSEPTNG